MTKPSASIAARSFLTVAVETWNGFVFVNPDRDAPSLASTFPSLGTLRERGLDFSSHEYRETSTYEVAANWKIGVENACECYHCPTIHSGSFGNAFEVGPEDYEYVNEGPMLCQFTDYNVASSRFHHERREGDRGFRFGYLWPLTFLAQDDDVAFGSTTGNVYVSDDRGDSWRELGHNFPPVYCVRFGQ